MNSGQIELRLQSLSHRLGWVPYFVLLIALAGTILGSWFVAVTGAEKDQARFANEVQSTADRITDRVATYENLLRGGAGLLAAQPQLSAEEFREYVDRLDLPRLYPGIQGIGYSMRVRRDEVAALEQSMSDTFPGFHVWPPTDDQYVHTIKYLEPLDRRNREAIGYNMFSQSDEASGHGACKRYRCRRSERRGTARSGDRRRRSVRISGLSPPLRNRTRFPARSIRGAPRCQASCTLRSEPTTSSRTYLIRCLPQWNSEFSMGPVRIRRGFFTSLRTGARQYQHQESRISPRHTSAWPAGYGPSKL